MLLTGEVAAVSAAIEKAKTALMDEGAVIGSSVIPRPDEKLWKTIL
ncbi:MAG: BMC domain-containing protein, partial [Clostridia bacterium]|nr:BMC domain-containing protein [Clostridia bacterium]